MHNNCYLKESILRMTEPNEINKLLEHISTSTTSEITCGTCPRYTMISDSGERAAEHFYNIGWRYIDDEKAQCPECRNKNN